MKSFVILYNLGHLMPLNSQITYCVNIGLFSFKSIKQITKLYKLL